MSSLIKEIIQDTIDDKVNINSILRKALYISSNLNQKDTIEWVKSELYGYESTSLPIPSYRIINGELKTLNPYNGELDNVRIKGNPETMEFYSKKNLGHSIEEIQRISQLDGDIILLEIPKRMALRIKDETGMPNLPEFAFSKIQCQSILETVRTKLMEWAMALEKNGITGEGTLFTEKEITKASHINYNFHFHGDVSNSQFNNNSKKANQDNH